MDSMENKENLFEKLKQMAGNNSANINILQEQIDVELQMAYFKLAKLIKKDIDKEKDYLQDVEKLYNPEVSLDEKKKLICILASFDNVAYYRSLEKFKELAGEELKAWVTLGVQESRMMLESSLLDEKQLFISTGLGGKGTNLRYFVVLINNNSEDYTKTQQKLINQEFEYSLTKNGGELEEVIFDEKFAKLTCLLPIEKPVQEILSKTTKECNGFGQFINENFLITNVKKMSTTEIQSFLDNQDDKSNELPEIEDIDMND
jgi:hypothetical protein